MVMDKYIDEKTITLTVAEFRKNVKAALDFAVEGGVVIIDRMGQRFILTNIGRDTDIQIAGGVMLQSTPAGKNKIRLATPTPRKKGTQNE